MTVNEMIYDLNVPSNQKIKIHESVFLAVDLIIGPLSKVKILRTKAQGDVIELEVADD